MHTNVLSGLSRSDITVEPFPHIVAPDRLPEAVYRELSESFPPLARIVSNCAPERIPSNHRYALPAHMVMDAPDLPECWKSFVARHSEPAFFEQVAALFDGHWPEPLLRALGGGLGGHSCGRLRFYTPGGDCRIHQDARLEINTPVRGAPSASRGPHLDTPNRIFTCLLYFRHPDDDAVGGDLVLYRWRNGPVGPVDAFVLPDDAVEPVAVVPYRPNQLVIFPQSIDSLHGVGVRHPTPHTRRYLFISAELAENWRTPCAC